MYMRRTRAIPETMAEKRKTIGIIGVDFGYGFAARDPDGYTVRVFTPDSPDA